MAYGFERTGYVSAQGSANDLPDGDWAVGGWVRIEDNHGNEAPQIVDQHPPAAARFSLAYYEDEYPLPDYRNRFTVLVRDDVGLERRIDSQGTYAASGAWQHVLVQRSGGVIRLYVAGSADPVTAEACGTVTISADMVFGRLGAMSQAEWAKWDRSLGAREIRALAGGLSPRLLPQSCRWYLPMLRTLHDLRGALTLCWTNTAAARHPRIFACSILQLGGQSPSEPPEPPGTPLPPALRKVLAGRVWHAGAASGLVDVPGARLGQVQTTA